MALRHGVPRNCVSMTPGTEGSAITASVCCMFCQMARTTLCSGLLERKRLICCTARQNLPNLFSVLVVRVQPHRYSPRSISRYPPWQISRFTRAICWNGLSRTLHKNPCGRPDGERKIVWEVMYQKMLWTRLNAAEVATIKNSCFITGLLRIHRSFDLCAALGHGNATQKSDLRTVKFEGVVQT